MHKSSSKRQKARLTVSVIIPAYNAEQHLDDVLSKLLKWVPGERITVVDDGSRDATAEKVLKHKVRLIRHHDNRGKGAALRTGFCAVKDQGPDAILTLDADGQHNPDAIPQFMDIMEKTGADLVIGKRRFHPSCMPIDRIFSNRASSWMLSQLLHTKIPDSQCGYRLYRAVPLMKLHVESRLYEIETELLFKGIQSGWHLEFCPIETIYNQSPSHVRRVRDTVLFFSTLFRQWKGSHRSA